MNKQELIKEYESIIEDNSLELCGCYNMADKVFMRKIYKSVLEDLKQLDEPQKVTIPQFVADYIKYAIENDWDFQDLFKCIEDEEDEKLSRWVYHERNQETLAAAWINGYTVEKEKRYLVQMNVINKPSYLNHDIVKKEWFFSIKHNGLTVLTHHTRKELEEAGLSDVFNSPLFEVEEVE